MSSFTGSAGANTCMVRWLRVRTRGSYLQEREGPPRRVVHSVASLEPSVSSESFCGVVFAWMGCAGLCAGSLSHSFIHSFIHE